MNRRTQEYYNVKRLEYAKSRKCDFQGCAVKLHANGPLVWTTTLTTPPNHVSPRIRFNYCTKYCIVRDRSLWGYDPDLGSNGDVVIEEDWSLYFETGHEIDKRRAD